MTHEAFTDTSRLVEARLKNLKQEVIKSPSTSGNSNPINQSNSSNSEVQSGQRTGPKKVFGKMNQNVQDCLDHVSPWTTVRGQSRSML